MKPISEWTDAELQGPETWLQGGDLGSDLAAEVLRLRRERRIDADQAKAAHDAACGTVKSQQARAEKAEAELAAARAEGVGPLRVAWLDAEARVIELEEELARQRPVIDAAIAFCDEYEDIADVPGNLGPELFLQASVYRRTESADLGPEAFYVAVHPALVAWMGEQFGDTSLSDALAEAFEPWYAQYLARTRALDATYRDGGGTDAR